MRRARTYEPADALFTDDSPLELQLVRAGCDCLCGTDEAGRGPLAGPVVAAAVVYRDCESLWMSRDSKSLTRRKRENLLNHITRDLAFAVGICSVEEIDELNILRASLVAMERAVAGLPEKPSLILVDGPYGLSSTIPSRAIVRGDARVAVIAAASIVAKVHRDTLMTDYDRQYPGYGFAHHFGYPTQVHRDLLREKGPCPIHRRTFRGVRELLQETL
jgi:ribonuclease HII